MLPVPSSPKSYAVAVCLSGIFGLLGIHHFYLGRWLHGLFDLGMTVGAFLLLITGHLLYGYLLLGVDMIHTFIITIMLLTGTYRDGHGLIVAYPGQFENQNQ